MAFSPVGRVKVTSHAVLFVINVVVLALATRVNHFQEFFYIADLFPLALSIATLISLTVTIALDFALESSFTGRPQFEIGHLGLLSIFWLAFNAFSTSRWHAIPFKCSDIPTDFPDERVWCKDLQALKAFIWIEFVICFLVVVMTIRYSFTQRGRGHKHIFKMPLSRYHPEIGMSEKTSFARDSEFLQFEKLT